MADSWIHERFPGAAVTPVTAGWSADRKYHLATETGPRLLRISPIEAYPRKQQEFAQLQRLNRLTDAFPEACECGIAPGNSQCYVVYGWVEGREALGMLPQLQPDEHRRLGTEAGRLLRMVHSLPQDQRIDSHDFIRAKMTSKHRMMREYALHFPAYDPMVAFLESNLHRLRGAPTAYRHGDFHLGNMLLDQQGRLKVIDFNRSDFGDPIEDFNRLFTFSRQASPAFARGQIEGYFDDVPESFFAHALCYVLMDCTFGLLWARQFGQREVDVHFGLVEQIMGDFDNLRATRPKWYDAT